MDTFAIPIDLTAFALSPGCFDGLEKLDKKNSTTTTPSNPAVDDDSPVDYKIAPITQPNYVGLRLDESLIQHDILDHADMHLTSPAENNPRVTDLGSQNRDLRRNRLGVYLHWCLPRLYRSATQAADSKTPKVKGSTADPAQQVYPNVPNRWLVVRHITAQVPTGKLPDFQSWVVESDRRQNIDAISDDVDLETDVTPFVAYDGNSKNVIKTQAEVFIGRRNKHSGWGSNGWSEDPSPKPTDTIDLTIMNSANPLFPDYVPHNSSVFSIVDSFEYTDSGNPEKQHLTSATADYFVIGWHSKDDGPLRKPKAGQLRDRLASLFLQTNPNPSAEEDTTGNDEMKKFQDLLQSPDLKDVLLHGAIYDVKYNFSSTPDSVGVEAAKNFKKENPMEPLSIGTTPLDAVLTFLDAHRGQMKDFFGTDVRKGQDVTQRAADDIMDLASLLYAADDSYDSRVKAQDLLYTDNWSSSQGGFQWKYDGKKANAKGRTQGPAVPSESDVEALLTLNEMQARYDVLASRLQDKRWALFSRWWNFVSDRTNYSTAKVASEKPIVQQLKTDVKELQRRVDSLQDTLDAWSGTKRGKTDPDADKSKQKVACKRVPLPTFFTKKDPTLCIAGMESGWPKDFLQTLKIKTHEQLPSVPDPAIAADFGKIFGNLRNPLPSKLQGTANRLLAECLKHKQETDLPKGFLSWGNKNPFAPMFIEWEGLYYHLPRNQWDVGVRKSRHGNNHDQVRFAVNGDQPLFTNPENKHDYRWVSGRVLILPQPVFTLTNIVKSVLANTKDPDLVLETDPKTHEERKLDDQEREIILQGVENLKFISAPLDGLTNHLLTRYTGTHVTPTIRVQGQDPIAMTDAYEMSEDAKDKDPLGFGEEGVLLMDPSGMATPYGNLMNFDSKTYPKAPFKGVTHGQMMITKLNIIDKFGQAVCLPGIPHPPKRLDQVSQGVPPKAIYPCLSDYLTPDVFRVTEPKVHDVLNTIYSEDNDVTPGKFLSSRFIQLPPAINQDARINAAFVTNNDWKTKKELTSSPFWRETIDDMAETPIVGWVLTNFQDNGIQLFLPDGTFYREIRIGGPNSTNAGGKWLPFDPPTGGPNTGTKQLDGLIEALSNKANPQASLRFLQEFANMINQATKSMSYAPSDYAAYANSLVGKPLALINVGWSLELSKPPLRAQNTLGNLPADSDKELKSYSFPIKIGDADRPFDGVLGFWKSSQDDGSTAWEDLYSYFPPEEVSGGASSTSNSDPKVIRIEPSNFQDLSPTYIDPVKDISSNDDLPQADHGNTRTAYHDARCKNYLITTMLVDPYTPIHAYSPILPIKSLQLPAWTIQAAFSRMTAFFRLGPNLISRDVPVAYNAKAKIDSDSWLKKQSQSNPPSLDLLPTDPPVPIPPTIRLPIQGKSGLWQWLQPYNIVENGEHITRFNALDVDPEDTRIRKDAPPYTFVEGYLQLARPLLNGASADQAE